MDACHSSKKNSDSGKFDLAIPNFTSSTSPISLGSIDIRTLPIE